jgi:hypothetical protein
MLTGIWAAWGVMCFVVLAAPEAKSIPVVPNFQQGTLKSTTTTKTKVNEVINSYRYRTGYEYTVTGTNVEPNASLAPMGIVMTTNSLNGVGSVWRGLDPSSKPSWSIVNEAASFSFSETLQGPGLTEHTIITRETDVESTTETLSTFTQ